MKQKDMNMIMAAVAILVTLKTKLNRSFHKETVTGSENNLSEEATNDEETPNQMTDDEYEYLNELLEQEDFDFQNFKVEDFEQLDFQKLMRELNNNLKIKSTLIKKDKTEDDSEAGEAVSDY